MARFGFGKGRLGCTGDETYLLERLSLGKNHSGHWKRCVKLCFGEGPLPFLCMAGEGDANPAESLRLTRSATIFNSLLRFYGTGKLPSQLVLHIVGADYREGRTPDQTRSVFRDLHQWLWDEGVRTLSMLLCGPNIALGLHGTRHTFSHQTHTLRLARLGNSGGGDGDSDGDDVTLAEHEEAPPIPKNDAGICGDRLKCGDSALLTVTLQFDKGLYHDVAHLFPAPDAMFLFNAGLWGYDDWLPTMELILRPVENFSDRREPSSAQASKVDMIVVTSYCAEEAEDDMDTLERLLVCGRAPGCRESSSKTETLAIENGTTLDSPLSTAPGRSVGGVEWLWGPEVNPFRSLVPRNTECGEEGRLLFENHSWQAICPLQLGDGVSNAST